MHCIIQLLEQGYRVCGTLRDLSRQGEVQAALARRTNSGDRLEFVQADLLSDAGWDQAVNDCTYVLHVASPFPLGEPEDEQQVIRPAVDGTRRVLQAASRAAVKRVVMTSSTVAILTGRQPNGHRFDESDWANLDVRGNAYGKSKTLAEQAAWNFMKGLEKGHAMELAVINPGFVLGPLLDAHMSSSGVLVEQLMKGKVPGIVRMHFEAVDVRDVADVHLLAMLSPAAAGERFICVGTSFWMKEVSDILSRHYSGRGDKVPMNVLPSWLVRLVGRFDKAVALTVNSLDQEFVISSEKSRQVLKWQPRSLEDSLISMADSMIEYGLV